MEVCVCSSQFSVVSVICVCVWVRSGLPVEKRAAEEKLEGTVVHPKAKQPVLLHRRGPQGLPRQHSSG